MLFIVLLCFLIAGILTYFVHKVKKLTIKLEILQNELKYYISYEQKRQTQKTESTERTGGKADRIQPH